MWFDGRSDLSKWLVHFVRDREPGDNPAATPEEYERWSDGLEDDASAFSILRHIIRLGGLKPGFGFRGGQATVYGGSPVVCFTEMPLYAFAKYVSSRRAPTRVGPYGIAVLREELAQAGARPVIYGLSGDYGRIEGDGRPVRLLGERVLPLVEQYRFVAFDPARTPRPIDWTHEREWRWRPEEGNRNQRLFYPEPWGDGDFGPGLPLFRGPEDGGYFSQVVVIVHTEDEASDIAEQLLMLSDSEGNDWDEPFSRSVLGRTAVVPLSRVVAAVEERRASPDVRLETLLPSMVVAAVRPPAKPDVKRMVKDVLAEAHRAAEAAARSYPTEPDRGLGCGGAFLVTFDPTSDVTAALLEMGLAHSMAGEYYTVEFRLDYRTEGVCTMLRDYEETVLQAAADVLTARTGQRFFAQGYWD